MAARDIRALSGVRLHLLRHERQPKPFTDFILTTFEKIRDRDKVGAIKHYPLAGRLEFRRFFVDVTDAHIEKPMRFDLDRSYL